MRTIDVIQGQSNRNQNLRMLMLLIIAGTFPFYCFAIIVIGSAPTEVPAAQITETAASAPSFTPLGADRFPSPTVTAGFQLIASNTPLSVLPPTPVQYVPPTPLPAQTIVAQTIVSPSPFAIEESATPAATATTGVADADLDGVADANDNCPNEFGFADNQGCPYPDDPDRDGIRGDVDFCPNEYAFGSLRGCRDFDDDGLDTYDDDCPRVAGPSANRGCPLEGNSGG